MLCSWLGIPSEIANLAKYVNLIYALILNPKQRHKCIRFKLHSVQNLLALIYHKMGFSVHLETEVFYPPCGWTNHFTLITTSIKGWTFWHNKTNIFPKSILNTQGTSEQMRLKLRRNITFQNLSVKLFNDNTKQNQTQKTYFFTLRSLRQANDKRCPVNCLSVLQQL